MVLPFSIFPEVAMRETRLESGGRYPVLRAVAILWMIGAAIACIYGLYQAIVTLAGVQRLELLKVPPDWVQQVLSSFIWLGVTFFAVIFNLAVAEGIKLFMDIERSCRSLALGSTPVTPTASPSWSVSCTTDGGVGGRFSEETAESALIKGH
jgi:hypothetical protein